MIRRWAAWMVDKGNEEIRLHNGRPKLSKRAENEEIRALRQVFLI